jgi:hypothetical protein
MDDFISLDSNGESHPVQDYFTIHNQVEVADP